LFARSQIYISDQGGFPYGLGIIEPHEEDKVDEDSVGYFSAVDNDEIVGAQRVDSYSSVKEGMHYPI
jgi:hypothetical protein